MSDEKIEIKTFEELVQILESAESFVVDKINDNIDAYAYKIHETDEFMVGHFMGMRDCLIVVQGILRNRVLPEIKTNGEEE